MSKATKKHKGAGKYEITLADGTLLDESFNKDTADAKLNELNSDNKDTADGLVVMFREQPMFIDGPTECDVHTLEVDNYKNHGWKVKA